MPTLNIRLLQCRVNASNISRICHFLIFSRWWYSGISLKRTPLALNIHWDVCFIKSIFNEKTFSWCGSNCPLSVLHHALETFYYISTQLEKHFSIQSTTLYGCRDNIVLTSYVWLTSSMSHVQNFLDLEQFILFGNKRFPN